MGKNLNYKLTINIDDELSQLEIQDSNDNILPKKLKLKAYINPQIWCNDMAEIVLALCVNGIVDSNHV